VSVVDVHDPFFFPVTSTAFDRDRIADLAAGRCAAIRAPDLLPREQCGEVLSALSAAPFAAYGSKRVYPPVMRFGVGVSDHRRDGKVADTYWPALEESNKAWLRLGLSFDPFEFCRSAIGASWPHAVRVGSRDGRKMGAGVAREPNQGFIVHFDDANREFSGNLLDVNLVAQFAFNLYLSMPQMGGETVVWRHRWRPGDEQHRLPGSYGYSKDVIGEEECFELKPAVGEGLLFDPRNFHAVRPSRDSRRIALGFSLGFADTGELWAWA
jgi:hypothetical protein